ncbi:MAG: DUF3604 domain-containing protein [Acidobacteriota bacterium]|nr:MAG: DUF3604 domain-containing protein [Acidobacteriota bacterium]
MAKADLRHPLCFFLAGLFLTGMAIGSQVSIDPISGIAGEYGTWIVAVEIGPEGIQEGGGIRVQLPDSWHAGERNSANRLQAVDPTADHFISARGGRPGVQLHVEVESQPEGYLVKQARPGLDGRLERYVFVVRVTVTEGSLKAGDNLQVIYGDRSQGSRGMKAAVISTEPETILVAVDSLGQGDFQLLPDRPTIQSLAGSASELLLNAPSEGVVGEPFLLKLAVVDRLFNPVNDFAESVELDIVQGNIQLPSSLSMQGPSATIEAIPTATGIIRLRASAQGGILSAFSNPVRVTETEPEQRTYWGDLHSHSTYSWDGVGNQAFQYARQISALDFYAMTDHSRSPSQGMSRGLGPGTWKEYTEAVERNNVPGQFVTLHAYEASFGTPWGHHNVYFRNQPGPLVAGEGDLTDLWAKLEEGEALTIPHHTGKFPSAVNWEHDNPAFRRNFEIYSAHGLSEAFDPEHPLSFENSDFTSPARSSTSRSFAQDAWIYGLFLSSVASSDDHRAQPGKPNWGLAAIKAPELSREGVFSALYERRTYATTGARILLDFSINQVEMGQQVTVETIPFLSLEVHGTRSIETVEILRYSASEGGFNVVFSMSPDSLDFNWSSQDTAFREDSVYYARVLQRGVVRGLPAMAWSSPIWVRKKQ